MYGRMTAKNPGNFGFRQPLTGVNLYIYTQQIGNKILQYPRHRKKPLIPSITQIRRIKINGYMLAPLHFLDMEIVQSKPGVSQIRMYDKRDHMETLA